MKKQLINAVDIYAGESVSMVVDENGKMWTWGASKYYITGQLNYQPGKIQCINDSCNLNIENASFGKDYALVVDKNNEVWSWGSGDNYKNGFESNTQKPAKIRGTTEYKIPNEIYGKPFSSLSKYTTVSNSINNNSSCYPLNSEDIERKVSYTDILICLCKDGSLYVKGNNNEYGILGTGDTEPLKTLTCINDKFNNKKIKSIFTISNSFIMVVDEDDGYWAWGDNSYGQCGIGTVLETKVKEPHYLGEYSSMRSIQNSYFALDKNNHLYVWGHNNYNCLGVDGVTYVTTPTKIINESIKEIRYGNGSQGAYIVITDDGKLYHWGANKFIDGNSISTYITEPTEIMTGLTIKRIVYTNDSTYFLEDTEGNLWSGGYNSFGLCGANKTTLYASLSNIGKYDVKDIYIVNNAVILLENNGQIWSCGYNREGQCGIGDTSISKVTTPTNVKLPDGVLISEIISTTNNTIIIKDSEGKLWAWGKNQYGKAGNGNANQIDEPVRITTDEFESIRIDKILLNNTYLFMMQDTNGNIWTWGSNSNGECGVNSTDPYLKPTCINSIDGYEDFTVKTVRMAAADRTVTVVDNNSKVWKWGCTYASLGISESSEKILKPLCITDYYKTTYGYIEKNTYTVGDTTVVIDTDDKLWTYGKNTNGLCGTGDTNEVATPVCISDMYNFKCINILYENTNASKAIQVVDENNNIWRWGTNAYTLVDGVETESKYIPVCITKDNNIKFKAYINEKFIVDQNDRIWKFGNTNNSSSAEGESLLLTCINDNSTLEYSSDLKGSQVGTVAYFLNEKGEAWICGNQFGTSAIKINTLKGLNRTEIKEIGYGKDQVYVLTVEGNIYCIKVEEGKVVADQVKQDMYKQQYTIEGAWKNEFLEVYNTKYQFNDNI